MKRGNTWAAAGEKDYASKPRLDVACRLMVDKITTVPKCKIGALVGRLDDEDFIRLNRALLVFLGLAAPP
jgi:mRNA interferase MazF